MPSAADRRGTRPPSCARSRISSPISDSSSGVIGSGASRLASCADELVGAPAVQHLAVRVREHHDARRVGDEHRGLHPIEQVRFERDQPSPRRVPAVMRPVKHRPQVTRRHPRQREDGPVTYSIVARDPESGAFGVAVQSHYFSVGAVVPWVEAGVGAVATQALAELSYGPLGLERMRAGEPANAALAALVAADPGSARRDRSRWSTAPGWPRRTPGASCIDARRRTHRRRVVGAGEHDAQRRPFPTRWPRRYAGRVGRSARPPARHARRGRGRGRRRPRAAVGRAPRVVDRADGTVSAGLGAPAPRRRPRAAARRAAPARARCTAATSSWTQRSNACRPAISTASFRRSSARSSSRPTSNEIRFRLAGLAHAVRRSARPPDARRAVRGEPGLARADPAPRRRGHASPTFPASSSYLPDRDSLSAAAASSAARWPSTDPRPAFIVLIARWVAPDRAPAPDVVDQLLDAVGGPAHATLHAERARIAARGARRRPRRSRAPRRACGPGGTCGNQPSASRPARR